MCILNRYQLIEFITNFLHANWFRIQYEFSLFWKFELSDIIFSSECNCYSFQSDPFYCRWFFRLEFGIWDFIFCSGPKHPIEFSQIYSDNVLSIFHDENGNTCYFDKKNNLYRTYFIMLILTLLLFFLILAESCEILSKAHHFVIFQI